MELELIRTYYPSGTNGRILFEGRLIAFSIELPWKDNHTRVSCIPEGRYRMVKRWSPKFNRHWRIPDVPRRNDILIHPANDALHELKGCIAPVSLLTGPGRGLNSRLALDILNSLVDKARDPDLFLNIKSDPYESS